MATVYSTSSFPFSKAPHLAKPDRESNPSEGNLMRSALIRHTFFTAVLCFAWTGTLVTGQTVDWKDYLGGPAASHYSPLKQINVQNVNKLELAWSYPTGDETNYTFSPLVIDNVAYIAAKKGALVA